MEERKRELYLDIIKVIAIFVVVFGHTPIAQHYKEIELSFSNLYTVSISSFIEVCVPLFFMISGVLLIPKDEGIKTIYLKRLLPKVILFVIFCALFYFIRIEENKGVWDFIKKMYNNEIDLSFKFIHLYFCFLLILPFIKKLAKNLTKSEINLFLIFVIIQRTLIPVLKVVLIKHGYIEDSGIFNYLFFGFAYEKILIFPILGYVIHNYIDITKITKKLIIILIICAILCNLITTFLIYYEYNIMHPHFGDLIDMFDYFYCFVLFIVVKKICYLAKKKNVVLENCIIKTAKVSLEIFLISTVIRWTPIYHMLFDNLPLKIGYLASSIIITITVFITSLMLSLILKSIPYIKKYI